MTKQLPQDITEQVILPFSADNFGLYVLKIIAHCQSGSVNGQDLRIEIDRIKFREVPPQDRPQYDNIPPAWNGSQLKGLSKTIFFILALNKGPHEVTLIPTDGAHVESFDVKPIIDLQNIVFEINEKAEERDRQPWYTFAFINLPLQTITADASVSWHFLDGDDVKLIVDNQIEENVHSKRWKYWVWSARPWHIFSGAKREQKTFAKNLPSGIHYVEFWADKTPTMHQVTFDLGATQLKRTPTVKEIILKKNQYDAFANKNTRKKVQDPLSYVSETEWKNCFDIAGQILSGNLSDPTSGATHFYSTSDGKSFPPWAVDDVFKAKTGITYFYELES